MSFCLLISIFDVVKYIALGINYIVNITLGKMRQKKSRGPKDDLIAKIQEFLFPCNVPKPLLHQELVVFNFLIGHFRMYEKEVSLRTRC